MNNGMSEYALEWYLKNPLESPTITFLAVIPGAISNLMVESFPGINEGTKGELSEKLDAYKEHKQDLFESKKEYLIECFKPIASNSEDIIKSIWKDPKLFSQLYRGWKAAMIGLSIPIEILPGMTPAQKSSERLAKIQEKLREGFTPYNPNMRKEIVISEEAKSFLDQPSPEYIKLVDDFVIRDMPCDVDSIRIFIHDNNLDETYHDDASFAGICMALVAAGALIPNTSEPETPLVVLNVVNEKSSVTAVRIPIWKRSARRMVDAAFAYASQGARGGDISWYESYSNVYGRLMRPKRFVEICECILASGFLFEYTRKLTVGHVRSSHNVINYRYKRLSTPDLIFEALRKVENETIYRMVEPEPLREYAKFQRAGVLAQIAAGPLKVYCKGNIDVLTTTDIADEVTISQLKAIYSAPYNSRLIRQAYMILSEYDEVPSNWYQGKKAMREADSKDYIFREVVKAYRASEKKAARELASVDTELDENLRRVAYEAYKTSTSIVSSYESAIAQRT